MAGKDCAQARHSIEGENAFVKVMHIIQSTNMLQRSSMRDSISQVSQLAKPYVESEDDVL